MRPPPPPTLAELAALVAEIGPCPPLPTVTAGPGAAEALVDRYPGTPSYNAGRLAEFMGIPIRLDPTLDPGTVTIEVAGGRRVFVVVDDGPAGP